MPSPSDEVAVPRNNRKVYVVVQGHFYADGFTAGDDVPIRAFADREQAEAFLDVALTSEPPPDPGVGPSLRIVELDAHFG